MPEHTTVSLLCVVLLMAGPGTRAFAPVPEAAAREISAPAPACCTGSGMPSCCEGVMDHDCGACTLRGVVDRAGAVTATPPPGRTIDRVVRGCLVLPDDASIAVPLPKRPPARSPPATFPS